MIEAIEFVEDCLDSTKVRQAHLAVPLDENTMRKLAEDSKLQYFPHFPRPYFRIERRRRWVIQGVIGNRSFRVTFLPGCDRDGMAELWNILGGAP
ncbi:MAG: hypothetical protein AAFX94_09355 [Myxococcota bacterium]